MTAKHLLWASGLSALALVLTACPPGDGGGRHGNTPDTPDPLPTGTVAFDYDRHLYFDALVGDSLPARLIFDTGATGLYLDSLWFAQSGLDPKYRQSAIMMGGTEDKTHSKAEMVFDTLALRVGDANWSSTATVIMQLKTMLGRRADGMFGQKYLENECVEFNLRRGYLRRASSDTLAAAGFTKHEIETRNHRTFVHAKVTLDERHAVEGSFILDMGSPHAVVLSSRAGHTMRFDSYRGRKIAKGAPQGGNAGWKISSFLCRADSMTFGGHGFAGVPIVVSQNRDGALGNVSYLGLIGNEMFERFDMVIDFAASELWLRPSEGIDAVWSYTHPGFSAIDRTDIGRGWLVTEVFEQPYAPEGLTKGDVVVAWDGVPVTKLDMNEVFYAPGPHRIEVLRGEVRTEYEFDTKEIL